MNDPLTLTRTIFDNVDFIAWTIDASGVVTFAEGKALRALGMERGQLLGASVFDIYRDMPDVINNVKRALAGEEFTSLTELNDRVLEVRYAPIRSKEGDGVGVAGVSTDVTERVAAERALERQAATLKEHAELLDLAHDAIMVRLFDGTITYWNRGAERMYGVSKDAAVGKTSHALLNTTFSQPRDKIEEALMAAGYWEGELTHARSSGDTVVVSSRWVLKRDGRGAPIGVLEINTDVTARKKAEAEEAHARRQEEIIRAQALAIAELSTPLIPITDDILVMPIVGVMDSTRAKQVMENLLNGLSSARGQFAIIDITGVSVVDTQVANTLVRAAHAVRLLGAEVILTGIRPEVAQTLVTIGADLSGITTRGRSRAGSPTRRARAARG